MIWDFEKSSQKITFFAQKCQISRFIYQERELDMDSVMRGEEMQPD